MSAVRSASGSERRYSATYRSSPVMLTEPSAPFRPFMDNPASDRPAGQPSVRRTSSTTSESASSTPVARSKTCASRRLRASIFGPISKSRRLARSRAIPNGGVARPAMTSSEPSGIWSASVETASTDSCDRSRSAPSSTITKRRSIEATAAARRGTAVLQMVGSGETSASSAERSIGSTPASAIARCRSRMTGSLSRESIDTHANGRSSRTAHCARSVVFP